MRIIRLGARKRRQATERVWLAGRCQHLAEQALTDNVSCLPVATVVTMISTIRAKASLCISWACIKGCRFALCGSKSSSLPILFQGLHRVGGVTDVSGM